MEEVKNKTKVEELEELLGKISIEMNKTRDRKTSIDEMTEELYNETRPMMVEKRKEEIEQAKNDKAEFDEMTKNALINAKRSILQIKEESEKEYQDKLLETLKRKQDIERKLSSMLVSMRDKKFPEEKLTKAEDAANKAMEKVNSEMNEFQEKHFILREKLSEYEKNVWDNALELGVEEEIDAVTLEEAKTEVKEEKKEPEKVEVAPEPQKQKVEPKQTESSKTEVIEPTKKEPIKPKETKTVKIEPAKTVEPIKATESKTTEPIEPKATTVEETKVESTEPVKPQQTNLKWHKALTPEQIEYAKSKDIYEPEGQEYEQFLRELGIKPEKTNEKQDVKEPTKELPEFKINNIVIEPIKGDLQYTITDVKTGKEMQGQFGEMQYSEKLLQQIKGVLGNVGPELDWESVSDSLDPNVIGLIAKSSGKNVDEMLTKYFDTLSGKETDLNISYNLKDIYNSDLDLKQIKQVMQIANSAEKATKGAIKVEKDSLLKRALGNIKKRFSELDKKLLESQNKGKIEKAKVENKSEQTVETPEKSKQEPEKVEESKDKTTKKKRFIGPKIPRNPEYYKQAVSKMVTKGKKIKNSIENKLAQKIDKTSLKDKTEFVPKVKVDEKAALEKVNQSKEPEEVIIENPDGTKKIAHRVWSAYDSKTEETLENKNDDIDFIID